MTLVRKEKPPIMLPLEIFEKSLSFGAIGLYAYLCTLEDDEEMMLFFLEANENEENLIKELESKDFLRKCPSKIIQNNVTF